jgi:hypothetical protein
MDEEDVLTIQEEEKINYLRESNKGRMLSTVLTMATTSMATASVAGALSFEPAQFTFERRLGLNPVVTINNISGKNAWVILAPAPIVSVGGIGVDNIANISLSTTGEYKCQQFLLRNNKSDDYDLDTSQLYYTVFFECDGTWKTPFKNRKINTRKYNINLLERHVVDSIVSSDVPN